MSRESLTAEQRDFFARNGFLDLGQLLTGEEVARFNQLFDFDRQEYKYMWHPGDHRQTANYDALVTTPAFDSLIRHQGIIPAVNDLFGGPTCFGEIGLRFMGPHDGEQERQWHRDRPHWHEHPLRLDYLQLMVFLSDVDESTHCFSISPESTAEPVHVDRQAQLVRGGVHDCHGPAGTCLVFNVAALHTATVRRTRKARRTVQIYYGHRARKPLANDSSIPATLWRDHADPEVRAFYGVLNDRTRLFMRAFGGSLAEHAASPTEDPSSRSPHGEASDSGLKVLSSSSMHENGPIANILRRNTDSFANFGGPDAASSPPWWAVFDMGSRVCLGSFDLKPYADEESPCDMSIGYSDSQDGPFVTSDDFAVSEPWDDERSFAISHRGAARYWKLVFATSQNEEAPTIHYVDFIPLRTGVRVLSSSSMHKNGPIANILRKSTDSFANFGGPGVAFSPPWWVVFDMGSSVCLGSFDLKPFVAEESPLDMSIGYSDSPCGRFVTSDDFAVGEPWSDERSFAISHPGAARYWKLVFATSHNEEAPTIHYVQFNPSRTGSSNLVSCTSNSESAP